jgi:hypothetical protein
MEEGEDLIVSIMLNDSCVENEDVDSDSAHFQQGANIDTFSVMKGNRFKIESQYEGWVENEEKKFKLVEKNSHGDFDTLDDSDQIDLEPGNYLFHEDGMTIEQLK